jgi:hypothetical protein
MKTTFGFAAAAPTGLLHVARARRESAAILMREFLPVSDRDHLRPGTATRGVASPARFLFLTARRRKCERQRVVMPVLPAMRPCVAALRAET